LRREDEIYHFLLPDANMVSSASIKLLKDEYQAESKRVTEWKKEFTKPIRADEYKLLQKISGAIDKLLLEHYELQNNIALLTQGYSDFFGNEEQDTQTSIDTFNYGQKETLAKKRFQNNAPYYKLKMIMDYWCALWFWDVRDAADLPTRREWYEDLMRIINIDFGEDNPEIDIVEEDAETYLRNYRKDRREREKQIAEQLRESTSSLFENERAERVKKYAKQYKFFHYELEFIEVFRENNGFDVAVGNPPWIKIQFEEKGLMSDIYPELLIRKTSATQARNMQEHFLFEENQQSLYFSENIENDVSATFMNAIQNYPLLKGQQTNLYKCIIENGLHWIADKGYLGLVHPEGIYDDPSGYDLRKEIYQRLKYHFQFQNAFNLFAEVAHREKYGIHIYSGTKGDINFYSINNIFHPATIDGCFIKRTVHESVKGLKVKNEQTEKFEWNIQPHPSRKVKVNKEVLKILARTFEDSDDWEGAKLVSIHAQEIIDIIKIIGESPHTVSDVEYIHSECWHETNAQNNGTIERKTSYPDINQYEVIYSGPHISIGSSFYKNPRKVCVEKADYDTIDLFQISENFIPRVNYFPKKYLPDYLNGITGFNNRNWFNEPKLIWRKMLSQAGERTFLSSIIFPKSGHIDGCNSLVFKDPQDLIQFASLTASISFDFYIKTTGKATLRNNIIQFMPFGVDSKHHTSLFVRTLQLNCLNKYYSPLWQESYREAFREEQWSIEDERLKPFDSLTPEWKWETPLRNYFERRQALVEIDVITAMALGISLDELILMYNIQFPVLQQNEDDTWYDTKGNIVFTVSKGLVGVGLDRPDWNLIKDMQAGEIYEHTITKSELYYGDKVTYYAPFTKQDRVGDYKKAWKFFEGRFGK
ncbi:MAG: type II restriction endonuclease subunit M, partial [Proteiniphilum sp.]